MVVRPGRRPSTCLLLLFIGTLGFLAATADEVWEPLGTLPAAQPLTVRLADTDDGIQSLDVLGAGSSPRLDPSFGAGGLVTTGWPPGDDSRLSALLVQPDGKIVLGGNSASGARLVRYLGDGSLDPAFAGTGILTFSLDGSSGYASALALQPDGKILVAGFFVPTPATQWRYVTRLNGDGTIDPAFGVGGYIVFGQPGFEGWQIDSLALQPDGKILVGGHAASSYVLGRLEEDGSADAGFGDTGTVITPFPGLIYPRATSIFLQAEGKIVVGGSYYHQALARYEPDGSLDPSFGDGGIVNTNLFDGVRWLGRQPDGKILVAGMGSDRTGAVMMVARFDTDGGLDATYGQDGVGLAGFEPLFGVAAMGTVLPDGKVVAVGEAARRQSLSDSTVALTGLRSDGRLDHGYQEVTEMMLPFLGTQFTGMALQHDGRILAVGYGRLDDQTYHWFVMRFLPKRSRLVLQEPL